MARAATAGELTNFRKDNQATELYLAILNPAWVMKARLAADPSSDDEVIQLTIDTVSWGSGYTTAPKDLLVLVGTTDGAYDKGMVRLRETLTGTPGTMKIGEISEIIWADNDYITIVDEFPFAPRHLYIDGSQVVYMDRDIAYSDQHLYPDPVPIMGPAITPVWMTGASVTVDFDSSDSYALDGGAITHSWSFPGSISSTGTTTATPTATYDTAGTYRVDYTASRDYGGGNVKTFTGYRYVMVFTTASPPVKFGFESCTGNWEAGGWSFRVVMHSDAGIADVRDRALVCMFAKDWYGTTETSIGPITDREEIIAIGWISGETIEVDPEEGTVTFTVQGPHFWTQSMEGFPSGLESTTTTPAAWTDYQTLTPRAGFWHFMHWRTTGTRIFDIHLTSNTTGVALFNASPGNLWEQVSGEGMRSIMAHPCCDRFGRLYIEKEPQIVPTGDRSGIPTVMTITTADLRRPYVLDRRVTAGVGLIDLSGVIYSGGVGSAIFSLAPGHIFKWHGGTIERIDRLALDSQAQANALAGLVLGWRNNPYPNVSLPFGCNNRLIDICPHQYLSLTLASGDTIRGISVALTLLARNVNYTYDPESGLFLVDVQAETTSVDGNALGSDDPTQDGDIPAEPPDPGQDYPNDDPVDIFDPLPPPLVPDWPVKVYVATKTNGVYWTQNFTGYNDSTQPTWALCNTGLPTTDARQLLADPGAPGTYQYLMLEATRDIYRRVSEGNWVISLYSNGATTPDSAEELVALSGEATDASLGSLLWMAVDRANNGYLYAIFGYAYSYVTNNCGWHLLKSTNYGATWAYQGQVKENDYHGYWLRIYGNYMYWHQRAAATDRFEISTAGGGTGTWDATDGDEPLNPIEINPLDPTGCYCNGNLTDQIRWGDSGTLIVSTLNTTPGGALFFSPFDLGVQWACDYDSNNLYKTIDNWGHIAATYGILPTDIVRHMEAFGHPNSEKFLFFGAGDLIVAKPHHILVSQTDAPAPGTLVGKAGAMAATSPFTDSIPYTAGAVTENGCMVLVFA